jgi:hypothetical protein
MVPVLMAGRVWCHLLARFSGEERDAQPPQSIELSELLVKRTHA